MFYDQLGLIPFEIFWLFFEFLIHSGFFSLQVVVSFIYLLSNDLIIEWRMACDVKVACTILYLMKQHIFQLPFLTIRPRRPFRRVAMYRVNSNKHSGNPQSRSTMLTSSCWLERAAASSTRCIKTLSKTNRRRSPLYYDGKRLIMEKIISKKKHFVTSIVNGGGAVRRILNT